MGNNSDGKTKNDISITTATGPRPYFIYNINDIYIFDSMLNVNKIINSAIIISLLVILALSVSLILILILTAPFSL